MLKQLYQWHWISSAICLVGMLAFSITGITLNHASRIEAQPKIEHHQAVIPPHINQQLKIIAQQKQAVLPAEVTQWLRRQQGISLSTESNIEWSPDEIYISLPKAGGDAWVRFSLADAQFEYENTSGGMISLLNDLHKGRHTGVVWQWFIDIFAIASVIFSLTGLFILQQHARRRPMVWPLVSSGLLVPLFLVVFFVHL
ncbi:MAG: PepSY-associated TM helix domain-containing protein [Pseudomonadales bacterium]|nr:PepSY-associated TM helix domain-containing protein [Pseudomonadales bacterium]